MYRRKKKTNYKDSRWIRKREYILSRDDYECRESKRYGKSKLANTVHHIYPVETYPGLMFEDWNLLSITAQVHNTFHDRQTGAIINGGLYWQRRFRKQFVRWQEENGQK